MPPVTPTTIRATGTLWLLFVRRRKSADFRRSDPRLQRGRSLKASARAAATPWSRHAYSLAFAGRNPPIGFPPLGSPPSAGQIPEGVRSRGRNREAAAYDADASYANFSL